DDLHAQRWSADELAVLRRAAHGDTNPTIAAELGIGIATVGRVLRRFASFRGDSRLVGAADPDGSHALGAPCHLLVR
ncbi:MAG: helix-turn-helix domain-containing protein, partial [Candidatus Limnocylindrales bacterium]|nr:helix-turn-helix domain-containing protein [Candidatus Limnocylindrales bacterium]